MGTPTPKGAGVEAGLSRKARASQKWPWMIREWPWVSWWGGANVGASLRASRGGEASHGASCERLILTSPKAISNHIKFLERWCNYLDWC